jgi:hypothetical protein
MIDSRLLDRSFRARARAVLISGGIVAAFYALSLPAQESHPSRTEVPKRTAPDSTAPRSVSVTLDTGIASGPETGRVFVLVTDRTDKEPRSITAATYAYYFNDSKFDFAPFFGQDVDALRPGATVTLSGKESGFPFADLSKLPPGDYSIQAVFDRYEQVAPAHGKPIWLPMDHWEGSQFHLKPGNFYSDVQRIKVEAGHGFKVSLDLKARIPEIPQPQDTKFLKFRKFRSELASKFWGRDMPVGVNVLLPKGYDEHPNARYPVVFHMGHFMEYTPWHFPMQEPPKTDGPAPEQSPRWLWEHWMAPDTARVIVVTLLHPIPYYDDSYLVNSPNTGPWQDVLMKELLPYINREFRTIDAPWARVLTGGSTGGWISLYTQITQPESFGGAWVYCPDMVDYRSLVQTNMYSEKNYFTPDGYKWLHPDRPYSRTVTGKWAVSARQFAQLSSALGNRSRGGEWMDAYAAMFGPIGPDGYPIPLIDWKTGAIDHHVAETWRDNGFDLRYYMEKNWKTLGPKVRGQLNFLCGDMDQFYTNNALYLLEDFLKTTNDPPYDGSFRYGRPMIGHTFMGIGLDPWPFALLREMTAHMRERQPKGFDNSQWNYE